MIHAFFCSFGSVESYLLVSFDVSYCLNKSYEAGYVVSVPVADEDLSYLVSFNSCDVHLALGSFPTVDEKSFSFVF